MPYNPGITDISGQLLGRGMESAAQARSQGINAISGAIGGVSDFFMKKQEENKDFQAKSKAMENIISTHPEIFAPKTADGQPDIDKLQMFLQTDPNENLKQKYARLGTFLESTITSKKLEQIDAENKVRKQQADEAQLKIDAQKRQNAIIASMLAQEGLGVPNPVTGGQQIVGPSGAPQNQPGAAAAMQFAAQQPATPRTNWRDRDTLPTVRDAMLETALAGENTSPAAVGANLGKMQKEWRENRAMGVLYKNEDEAQSKVNAFNADPKNMGVVAMVQPDARGGFTIKKQTTTLRTSAQEAQIAGDVEEAKGLAKGAVDFNSKIASDAARAGAHNVRIDRMRNLLSYQGTLTGKGEENFAAMRAYASRLGWADAEKVEKQNELNALFKREQLDIVNETMQKGSTSDKERQLFADTVASLEKTPKANLKLLELTKAANDKAIAAERERQRLERAGLNERQIKKEMNVWINADENNMENFIPKEERYVIDPASGNVTRKGSQPGVIPSGWSRSK